MLNSLLALAFPKEFQLRRYADFSIKHDSMTCCSMPMRWQSEDDVAAQFVGFLQQFLEIFKELKGKKFYATGESVSACFLRILDLF
jgi:Serine carboxypeptidase